MRSPLRSQLVVALLGALTTSYAFLLSPVAEAKKPTEQEAICHILTEYYKVCGDTDPEFCYGELCRVTQIACDHDAFIARPEVRNYTLTCSNQVSPGMCKSNRGLLPDYCVFPNLAVTNPGQFVPAYPLANIEAPRQFEVAAEQPRLAVITQEHPYTATVSEPRPVPVNIRQDLSANAAVQLPNQNSGADSAPQENNVAPGATAGTSTDTPPNTNQNGGEGANAPAEARPISAVAVEAPSTRGGSSAQGTISGCSLSSSDQGRGNTDLSAWPLACALLVLAALRPAPKGVGNKNAFWRRNF